MGRPDTYAVRVGAAIAVVAGLAVAVWLGVPAPGRSVAPSAQHLPWPVLFGSFLGAELLIVRFWFRGDTHNFSLAGVPLLLGLVFANPVATLTARLAGTGVAAARRRSSADKVAFNLALVALETGVAVVAYGAVIGDASPVSPIGWLAGAIAVLGADVTSHLGVLAIIRVSTGPVSRAALATVFEVGAALVVTTAALSLVATLVLWVDARGGVLLVVVGVVAALAYRAYGALRGRYAGLEVLYRFTDALAPIDRPDDVVHTVLRQACDLLRAGRAQLTLMDGPTNRVSTLDGDEVRWFTESKSRPWFTVALDGGCALVDDGMSIVAPLRSGGSVIGGLTVEQRLGDDTRFTPDDLRVFAALANHASVALRNGGLLEEVRRQAEESMYRALHDELTGLGNRAHLVAEADRLLADADEHALVAIMLMDLDNFKDVNDTLGHHAGDAVLKQVAASLASIEDRAVVARLGGDEFAVAVAGVPDREAAARIARQVADLVQQPVVADIPIDVRVSLGVALAPLDGVELAELLRRADIAMYAAKASTSGIDLYSNDRDPHSARRLALAGELRGAIVADELKLHYQPKVHLASGRVTGVEALSRWIHPTHGFVPPDEFIPIAETSGLMRDLTAWVLDRALADLTRWGADAADLTVSVNVSARTLSDPAFFDDVRQALTRRRVDPGRLTIEITESSLMTQLERAVVELERLSSLGVKLSVDDFGTGYSSLAQLKGLPVHEVKIDKSFVMGLTNDPADLAIVEVVLQLASKLGLEVVAEGIEDVETFNRLRSLGCLTGQGYHIARPLPPDAVDEWLHEWRRPRLDALIVDDHLPFRTALRCALEDEGVGVVGEAEDGWDAVERAAQLQPRLVVLDLVMPRMSGLDALPRIRDAAPGATIVVVSGADDPGAAKRCMRLGAVAYLDKVSAPDDLAARLRSLVADERADAVALAP